VGVDPLSFPGTRQRPHVLGTRGIVAWNKHCDRRGSAHLFGRGEAACWPWTFKSWIAPASLPMRAIRSRWPRGLEG